MPPTPPAFVRELLRCPGCRSELEASGSHLACRGCPTRFPVLDGVPVLVRDDVGAYSVSDYEKDRLAPRPKSRLHEAALRSLPTLEDNLAASANAELVASLILEAGQTPLALNLGGKHPTAALASLRRNPRLRCVESDVALGAAAHLVSDPHELPFEDATFDAVFADAVLEHLGNPGAVVAEIRRVLRPGGLVYSDVPFLLAVHGGRYDFSRQTLTGHRLLFRGFHEVRSGVSGGPGAALANAIQAFLVSFGSGRRSRFALKTLCRLSLFWLKYLDRLAPHRPGAADAALGTFFIGLKRDRDLPVREILEGYVGTTPDLHGRAGG